MGAILSPVPPESGRGERAAVLGPLARLEDDPARAAILTDVDGTLAPIVPRPEEAAVPAGASELLARLSERFGLVGCVSGRQAEEARRLVGVEGIAYAGNHGLELLLPGEAKPQFDPALRGHENDAARFLAGLGDAAPAEAGLRLEDKGPIQALHWRGAADEQAAEAHAHEIGAAAGRAGLELRWGRKVLELRPPGGGGKDAAVAALLASPPAGWSSFQSDSEQKLDHAVYAGDDRTDLDAFRRLRELCEEGELRSAVCVGVVSTEGPAEIAEEADLTVDGPEGWLALLASLAG
jgi:trehalose 6-phosphate phosphatase